MKVLFVLTSHSDLGNTNRKTGYYLSEAAHPWKKLQERGIEIDFVSPKGGPCPLDPTSYDLTDPINREFWEDIDVQKKLKNTLAPGGVDANIFEGIHYVGGHGACFDFPSNIPLLQLAARIYEHGGVVSAVCHGPSGLLNIKLMGGTYLVQGKNVACFTNSEEEAVGLVKAIPFSLQDCMKERGAYVHVKPNWTSNVQVDGRLVTGQNPQSSTELGDKLGDLVLEVQARRMVAQ
ncbi:hypothetical protein RB653_005553 [Dictyostelium firmibasis]|uniref:DJ-1/PfpI domain-containing protein n=1 Tax=Dictyostelium firmibasis TaxID=79012 RepID=A0AAN7U7U6_9MYCE